MLRQGLLSGCLSGCVLAFAVAALSVGAQTTSANEWTWTGGSSQRNPSAVYGILQTPAAANTPGGRSGAVRWATPDGGIWVFGGSGVDSTGHDGTFSDLWELNPATGEWTWMAGPDKTEQSGVYGSLGAAAAGNSPGARSAAVSWTDSKGSLWLFGGEGFDSAGKIGYLNDLWLFNPSSKEWTWMGGSNTLPTCPSTNSCGPQGVYGTLGTASSVNVPGGRAGAVGWTDSTGNFWLLGGRVYVVYLNGWTGYLNDLWKFNPTTSQWTWMGGSSTVTGLAGAPGIYGTLQTPGTENVPGSRQGSVSWTDSTGNLWLLCV